MRRWTIDPPKHGDLPVWWPFVTWGVVLFAIALVVAVLIG